jgi:xanthine dehydrogenase iron-sulfur cluster and FAD-binding subunit A
MSGKVVVAVGAGAMMMTETEMTTTSMCQVLKTETREIATGRKTGFQRSLIQMMKIDGKLSGRQTTCLTGFCGTVTYLMSTTAKHQPGYNPIASMLQGGPMPAT